MSTVHVTAAHGAHTRDFGSATYEVTPAGVLRVRLSDGEDVVFSPVGWSRVTVSDDPVDDPDALDAAPHRNGRLQRALGLGS